MPTLTFTIDGTPMGKPRMTQRDKWFKRPCTTKYWTWKALVQACVAAQVGTLPEADRIRELSWVAYFVPPRGWKKSERAAAMNCYHRQKPDRDNIDKALLDALFADDSGIAAGHIEKLWGETARLEVTIEYD